MSEGKEKSGQITVAMIGCLGTIVATTITGIVALVIAYLPPRSELGTPIAVTPSGPQAAPSVQASAPTPTAMPPATPTTGATGEVDVGGTWQGYLTYVLGDTVTNFRYQLELTQDGNVITGKSRVEKIDDASSFAEYHVGAQLMVDDGQVILQIGETDLSNSNNYTSFVPSDPVVAKVMRLEYSIAQGKEVLEGEWRDFVGRNTPDGRIQLNKQP